MRKVIFLVIILLVIACNGKNGKDPPLTDKDFMKGVDGLVYDFQENAPPPSVFEETDFELMSQVWNKGAHTIEEAYIAAILEPAYMCVLSGEECVQSVGGYNSELSPNLLDFEPEGEFKGKTVATPDGTPKFAKFKIKAKKLDLLSVQHTSPIVLTSCYGYKTIWAQDVCIDPDPARVIDKVCEVKDIELKDQGAPVAITKIETRIMPDGDNARVQFLIYIVNKGDGEVVNRAKLKDACSSLTLEHDDWNRITLTKFSYSSDTYRYTFPGKSGDNIKCQPNPMRLTDDKSFIRCTVDTEMERKSPPFVTQAYIELEYGYTESLSKNVIIESVE